MDTIAGLKPDAENAREHNPRNIGMIVNALHEVGAARSIVIDEDGNILAGNATIEAAAEAGIENLQVVDVDGETIVAVRRTGLSDEQKKRLAYLDNRSADVADWSAEQILEDLAGGFDMDGLFTEAELTDFGWEPDVAEDAGPQMDKADELQEKWGVKRGDVFEIPSLSVEGKCHKIMCGDSTGAGDVAKLMGGEKAVLMLADPPYNVGVGYDAHVDDSKPEPEYEEFTRSWFSLWRSVSEKQIVTPGCNNLARWLRYFEPYHVAPWIKTNSMTNGKVSRFWCWEPTVFFGEPDEWSWEGIIFFGEKWERRRANDVFNFPIGEQGGVGDHPCPKPLKMWVDLVSKYAKIGSVIVDPFIGSGTTIVACEQSGHIGYGCEIAEKYVAVSLQRLTDMGLEARLSE